MMGNLARALDERHKVMHSSGKSQDTTAQAIRPNNHNNTTTDTAPPPPPTWPVFLLVDVLYIRIVRSCVVCMFVVSGRLGLKDLWIVYLCLLAVVSDP